MLSALRRITLAAAMCMALAAPTAAHADTIGPPPPPVIHPQPVAYYLVMLFSGSCPLGSQQCTWSWDWQANCLDAQAPYACYIEGTGTLQLSTVDCTAANLSGYLTYYGNGPNQGFRVTGATFGNQFAIQGSGGQFLSGMVDYTELCTGTSFLSLGGYGNGYVA